MWIVARTHAGQERRAQYHAERQGHDTVLPMHDIGEGRIRLIFPRYLFVKIVDHFQHLKSTRGISYLIGSGERPDPCPEREVERFRDVIELPKAVDEFRPGRELRVTAGAFIGHIGISQGMTPRQRVAVLLEFLGGRRTVELERAFLAPALRN